jgi:hypothetical protein
MSTPDMLIAALDYSVRGWPVFPLKPQSKKPATLHGLHDATTNPATLHRWFARGFPYNVAIRTGAPSGVFILDIDGELGAANLRKMESEHGALPATLISTTANGRHLWLTAATPIPCSIGKVAPGLDIRGDGGYVVAPPSVHPNGTIYKWVNDLPPAPARDWLVRLAQQAKAPLILPPLPPVRRRAISEGDGYGRAALAREIETFAQVRKGSRNAALNYASFRLYQLVAGGELDRAEVEQELIAAAHANGLWADPEDGPRSVMATIVSGANAGMRFPWNRRFRQ